MRPSRHAVCAAHRELDVVTIYRHRMVVPSTQLSRSFRDADCHRFVPFSEQALAVTSSKLSTLPEPARVVLKAGSRLADPPVCGIDTCRPASNTCPSN